MACVEKKLKGFCAASVSKSGAGGDDGHYISGTQNG